MDLKEALFGLFASNTTADACNQRQAASGHGGLPKNPLLDALTPLLGGQLSPLLRALTLVNNLLGARLGLPIDPSFLLTLAAAAWAINRFSRQLYTALAGIVTAHFMASITVASTDEIYTHMMKWLAVQPLVATSRSLMAETAAHSAWEDDEDQIDALQLRTIAGGGDEKYLNFSNQQANAPPRFTPAVGLHGFWYGARYFRLQRKNQAFIDDASNGFRGSSGTTLEKEEVLVISCFGRSTKPIKNLLQAVKQHYYSDHVARTTIKRPSPQPLRRFNARNWATVAVRPVRALRTVILDAVQKAAVLADMNEYLHPATPRWYANRGIPLRRGYLFHGPPGTGKTSLSFALAGVFGLDIYVISLLEPTLSEEDLGTLFSSLPRRCVVLLEDIDAAGLRRPVEEEEEEEAESEAPPANKKPRNGRGARPEVNGVKEDAPAATTASPAPAEQQQQPSPARRPRDDWKVSDLARALKGPGGGGVVDERKGISLSGLLNAIDGVASQEGRVLVMTTNHPEALDAALIRPGRVDLQVAFGNATGEQARELFERMYEADATKNEGVETSEAAAAAAAEQNDHTEKDTDEKKELERIATEFGDKIDDGLLSPAEIQGFLLKRKKDPKKALRETDRWVEAMKAQKESKTKVLTVQ
ncbi:hypothetical protein ACHAQA_000686 [Verticillium albo-atrum]